MAGKGQKGLGTGGAIRHRRMLRDNVQGITKPAVRRLARRGGVKRISGLVYEETRGVLKAFMEDVIRDAVTYTDHAKRKTVTALDVVYALKRQGRPLYGFGESAAPPPRPKRSTRSRAPHRPVHHATGRDWAPLTAAQARKLENVFDMKDPVQRLKNNTIDLTKADLRRVTQPSGWLNDNAINGYLWLLATRHSGPKVWAFPTQFYAELSDPDRGYPKVRQWTKRRKVTFPTGSLFDYDVVLVPIHVGRNHWSLGVLDFGSKTIEQYDSLNISDTGFFATMRQYLVDEFHDMDTNLKKAAQPKGFNIDEWTEIGDDTLCSKQTNGSDCGVFMLKHADFRCRGIDLARPVATAGPGWLQAHVPVFRQRIAYELATAELLA